MIAATSLRDLRRAVSRYRVLLAAGLAAGSVATAVHSLSPAPPATRSVLAVVRDLDGGQVLQADEVEQVEVPGHLVPVGALTRSADAVGRIVAGPVRAGESLTDVRLLGPGLLPPGAQVAVPVRVAEPATAALVRTGDVVDVLSAAPDGSAAARTVVSSVRVLSVPLAGDDLGEGALLVVAARRGEAADLAAAAVTGTLSVVVHGQ